MSREKLPDRRNSENHTFVRNNMNFNVTFGRDDEGQIKECFINAAKEGEDMELIMSDAATAFSVAMQHGATPQELYKSMRREKSGKPLSPLGFIVSQMIKANKDIPEEIKESA